MTGSEQFSCATPPEYVRGFGGWSHMKLGFISPEEIVVVNPGESTSMSLIPVHVPPLRGATKLIRIENPLYGGYLLIEVRKNVGYDSNLPGLGVLLSEVDERRGDGEGTVRVIAASGESYGTPMTGALFKAPGEPSTPCDTAPGISTWSRAFTRPVPKVIDGRRHFRTWQVGFQITGKSGHTYTVQVNSSQVGRRSSPAPPEPSRR